MENLDRSQEMPSQIMENLLTGFKIPEEKQMLLYTHIRLAYLFSKYEARVQCVQARLQALAILGLYCVTVHPHQTGILVLQVQGSCTVCTGKAAGAGNIRFVLCYCTRISDWHTYSPSISSHTVCTSKAAGARNSRFVLCYCTPISDWHTCSPSTRLVYSMYRQGCRLWQF